MTALTALDLAEPDTLLIVRRIDAAGDDAIRLKRMGIYVNGEILLVQAGDPLIVSVLGSRIGISRQLADKVHVTPHKLTAPEPGLRDIRRSA